MTAPIRVLDEREAEARREKWEMVVGLEVHVQLLTRTKAFCGCSTEFGAPPNTNVCPVCLALPGALPVLNEQAVELAVRAALSLECTVRETSVFARKNYFYPDLPKGYQISQFDRPLATGGSLQIGEHRDGTPVTVGITRVHMEEDAGKSLHDRYAGASAIDLNRAGVPLIEIVSEPDMRSTPANEFMFFTSVFVPSRFWPRGRTLTLASTRRLPRSMLTSLTRAYSSRCLSSRR